MAATRGRRARMPELIRPMLAVPGALPAGGGWAYEFKWDGVRIVSDVDGSARLLTRNDRDVTATYPELAVLAKLLGRRSAILDGEVVALDEAGRPSFGRLQRRMHVLDPAPALLAGAPVCYYVFDILWLDGVLLVDAPYWRRRQQLDKLGLDHPTVQTPPSFDGDGEAVLAASRTNGLEGVVAKRAASSYRPGQRSLDWVKRPLINTQEVVVGGWAPGTGRRSGMVGSLLLGVYDADRRLVYIGNVGTGWTEAMLQEIQARLRPRARRTSPFATEVSRDRARTAHWVRPDLVGEVEFRTWTADGKLRHTSWRGWRPDKNPKDVVVDLSSEP